MSEIVHPDLVGVAWPAAHPGTDPVMYGHVDINPRGAFAARSLQSFKLVYTVGRYGIDDTGSIRIVFRFMGDAGDLQTHDPQGYNFVTASASTDARLSLAYGKTAHQRPFFKALTVRLHGGYLREGDQITVVFGDIAAGSPGMQMQTFCDTGFEFKVLADVCATGQYYPLPDTPSISIVPGQVHAWKAVLPTLRRVGEVFRLGLKAEDLWGNPTPEASGELRLQASIPIAGLPATVIFPSGEKALVIDNLTSARAGELRIEVLDQDGHCLAEAGPLLFRAQGCSGYWGDLHGQSGESIGVTTARQYFDFARNLAFLDVTGHQANDFQVNNAFWQYLNELTAEYHEDNRFVVFPGYEWSGNTAVGGDRNVFFRHEHQQIHRSSHALLVDRSDIETDAPTAAELFEVLDGQDCVCFAHVGGRYADITQAHDPKLETAMEIHSAWGTFEWLLTDGFALGHRCGVVCNSDGHKGRPGASYPGAATFGAYGGLTCFLTEDFSRDGIFECLRRRHHYGTTGCRMHMQVHVDFPQAATLYERDPAVFDNAPSSRATTAMMGDIIGSDAAQVTLRFEVAAHAPIERVEIRNGTEVLDIVRPYTRQDLGSRIRVLWSGAEYRGRGRQSDWTGRAIFRGSTIKRLQKINAFNHERKLRQFNHDTVEWNSLTTGNFGGFDVWLDEGENSEVDVSSNNGSLRLKRREVGFEDQVLVAGGLEKKLRIFRLPENNPHRQLSHSVSVAIRKGVDNPLWICVTTEDGFQAWSSPVFVIDEV